MQDFSSIDLDELRQRLQDKLRPHRYQHSLATAEIAQELAARWGLDQRRAYLAGLLHDSAKSCPEEQLLSLALIYGVPVDDWTLEHPDLLHGPVAAAMLVDEWDIEDEEIEEAVRCHTLPEPRMSDFACIVYLADKIEPYRRPWPGLEELRQLAYEDINAAMEAALAGAMAYVREQEGDVHPATQEIWEKYRNKNKEL